MEGLDVDEQRGVPKPASEPARRVEARDNRARLLSTARLVFAEHGVDASLRDIARRTGVGIGTLYRHFPNRDALLEALLRDGLDTLCASARDLLAAPSPGEALTTWLGEYAAGSATYRGLPHAVLAALYDESSELHSACHQMNLAAAALVTRAQRAGAVRTGITAGELCALVAGIALAGEQVPDQPDLTARLLALSANGFLVR